jgi:hypothetical protein
MKIACKSREISSSPILFHISIRIRVSLDLLDCFLKALYKVRDVNRKMSRQIYLVEPALEVLDLVLLNDKMSVIEIVENILVVLAIYVHDDRFNGRVTLNENAFSVAQFFCPSAFR